MINKNLESLIDGINHISLNHEDLMDTVLDFSKLYCKKHEEDALIVDKFFFYGTFIDQSLMAAREAIVLAMNAITLDEAIEFKELISRCVNLENQRQVEESICADEDTKAAMREFLKELRKELFSRLYSQNKDLERFSKIPKVVLKNRYDTFMSQPF
jgi:hypothetical protein